LGEKYCTFSKLTHTEKWNLQCKINKNGSFSESTNHLYFKARTVQNISPWKFCEKERTQNDPAAWPAHIWPLRVHAYMKCARSQQQLILLCKDASTAYITPKQTRNCLSKVVSFFPKYHFCSQKCFFTFDIFCLKCIKSK
jgi:hypothetical protein